MSDNKKLALQIDDALSTGPVADDDVRSGGRRRIARMLSRDLHPAGVLASSGVWPTKALHSADGRITIAASASELEEVGRLRYELFFMQGGKTGGLADHEQRRFVEPVDELSLNLQYRGRAGIQGAVRLTRGNDALSDPHLQSVLDATGATANSNIMICSRVAVQPGLKAQAIASLFSQVYRTALLSGACYGLLAARDEMTRMFEPLGFRSLGQSMNDPIEGMLSIMRLDAYDTPYLRRIKSPCLSVADELFSPESDRHLA